MAQRGRFFERHKLATIVILNLVVLLVLVLIAEVVLRATADYAIDYYGGTRTPGTYERPYGTIKVNSFGYADEEFDLSTEKPRIGYVGDSVNFGIGAGYPHRVSDLVESHADGYAHWNVGAGVDTGFANTRLLSKARKFDLDTIVYLMNLNDLSAVATREKPATRTWLARLRDLERALLDPLRDNSYAYNWLRFTIKNAFQRLGYDYTGAQAAELYPSNNQGVIDTTCRAVNEAARRLEEAGIGFCVILLPYEMQVSNDAAERYRGLGFDWEEGFTEGSTQERLKQCLEVDNLYDARKAFEPEAALVGEYFVYDEGDKIDWNHPNRKGHAKIAEGFVQSRACPFLRGGPSPIEAQNR